MPAQFDPDKHHRRSIRLQGYNYASPGNYFVTICLQNRACLLGDIIANQMQFNDAGQMVHDSWTALPKRFPQIDLDAFVVMPNHFHSIITLQNTGGVIPMQDVGLGNIVGAFKSNTTRLYIAGVHRHGWEPFQKRLWQRNYYEHIVRDNPALQTLRQYILNNPQTWNRDQLHPNSDSNG
ncbi:MAG: transposase [Cyanobacteria bacterium J06635_1]